MEFEIKGHWIMFVLFVIIFVGTIYQYDKKIEEYKQTITDLEDNNKIEKFRVCEEMCFKFADQDNDGWVHWTISNMNLSEPIINYCPNYCFKI